MEYWPIKVMKGMEGKYLQTPMSNIAATQPIGYQQKYEDSIMPIISVSKKVNITR